MDEICKTFVGILPVAYGLAEIGHTASIFCCLLIALDRAVAFVRPLKLSALCKNRKEAWIALGFVQIFAAIFSIPIFFELKTFEFGLKPTPLRLSFAYQMFYRNGAKLIFKFVFPFSALIVLNLIILKSLRKSQQTLRMNAWKIHCRRRSSGFLTETRQVTVENR